MPAQLRIATFNLENFDDKPGDEPSLATRIAVMRPQLTRLRADVLCMQEVNGQKPASGQPRTLAALKELLKGTQYANYKVAHTKVQNGDPQAERNQVILSRFPITEQKQIKNRNTMPQYKMITVPGSTAETLAWERPILYAKLDVNGRPLHVFNLHLKSKMPVEIPSQMKDRYTWLSVRPWAEAYFVSSMKRVGQAMEVRLLVDNIFDAEPDAWIAVCGDLNANSDEVPVTAIRGPIEETGNPDLTGRVLVPCENTVPLSSRYSLFHLGRGEMIDHVLVSRRLVEFYRGAEIHNEILPDESGAFKTDKQFPESDHAPVVAEFALP